MKCGGRDLWKQAEDENITGNNRTWQSLKERFTKYILPSLDQFVKSEVKNDMLKFFEKQRKGKIEIVKNVVRC